MYVRIYICKLHETTLKFLINFILMQLQFLRLLHIMIGVTINCTFLYAYIHAGRCYYGTAQF